MLIPRTSATLARCLTVAVEISFSHLTILCADTPAFSANCTCVSSRSTLHDLSVLFIRSPPFLINNFPSVNNQPIKCKETSVYLYILSTVVICPYPTLYPIVVWLSERCHFDCLFHVFTPFCGDIPLRSVCCVRFYL